MHRDGALAEESNAEEEGASEHLRIRDENARVSARGESLNRRRYHRLDFLHGPGGALPSFRPLVNARQFIARGSPWALLGGRLSFTFTPEDLCDDLMIFRHSFQRCSSPGISALPLLVHLLDPLLSRRHEAKKRASSDAFPFAPNTIFLATKRSPTPTKRSPTSKAHLLPHLYHN